MLRKISRKLRNRAKQRPLLQSEPTAEDLAAFRSSVSISFVLTELRDNGDQEDVQDSGMQVLRDIIGENPTRHGEIIVKSGGIPLLLAAVKRFPNHALIHANALEILAEIAGTKYVSALDGRTIETVCWVLKKHPRNRNLHLFARTLLLKWIFQSGKVDAPTIPLVFVQALFSIMGIMPERFDVQMNCLVTLDRASLNRQNWEFLHSAEVFAAILSTMVQWGGFSHGYLYKTTCMLCQRMTYDLCQQKRLRGMHPTIYCHPKGNFLSFRIMTRTGMVVPVPAENDVDILSLIHATMVDHKDNWQVQVSGLIALTYLSSTQGVDDVWIGPTMIAILSCMMDHPNTSMVQTCGCLALTSIFLRNATTSLIAAPRTFQVIASALYQHKDNSWTRVAALAALATLRITMWMEEDDNLLLEEEVADPVRRNAVSILTIPDCDGHTKKLTYLVLTELLLDYDSDPEVIVVVVQDTISVLQSPRAAVVLQVSALGVLNAVLLQEGNVEAFISRNGVSAVATLMLRDGQVVSDFDKLGIRILHLTIHSGFPFTAMDQKRCIEALVAALPRDLCQKDETSEQLILNSLAALVLKGVLCILDLLETPGGLGTILEVTHTREANFMIHCPCFHILFRVSLYATSEEIEEALLCATRKIITLMTQHCLADRYFEMYCGIIHSVLTSRPSSHRAIVQAGGIEALAKVMEQGNAAANQNAALDALLVLAKSNSWSYRFDCYFYATRTRRQRLQKGIGSVSGAFGKPIARTRYPPSRGGLCAASSMGHIGGSTKPPGMAAMHSVVALQSVLLERVDLANAELVGADVMGRIARARGWEQTPE